MVTVQLALPATEVPQLLVWWKVWAVAELRGDAVDSGGRGQQSGYSDRMNLTYLAALYNVGSSGVESLLNTWKSEPTQRRRGRAKRMGPRDCEGLPRFNCRVPWNYPEWISLLCQRFQFIGVSSRWAAQPRRDEKAGKEQ